VSYRFNEQTVPDSSVCLDTSRWTWSLPTSTISNTRRPKTCHLQHNYIKYIKFHVKRFFRHFRLLYFKFEILILSLLVYFLMEIRQRPLLSLSFSYFSLPCWPLFIHYYFHYLRCSVFPFFAFFSFGNSLACLNRNDKSLLPVIFVYSVGTC
jgi:hypothetical protein